MMQSVRGGFCCPAAQVGGYGVWLGASHWALGECFWSFFSVGLATICVRAVGCWYLLQSKLPPGTRRILVILQPGWERMKKQEA